MNPNHVQIEFRINESDFFVLRCIDQTGNIVIYQAQGNIAGCADSIVAASKSLVLYYSEIAKSFSK